MRREERRERSQRLQRFGLGAFGKVSHSPSLARTRPRQAPCDTSAPTAMDGGSAANAGAICGRRESSGTELMRNIGLTILLLSLSNIFMTFAWYAHLKELNNRPWIVAALVS